MATWVNAAASCPVTTDKTPLGSPASSKILAISSADKGVGSEGFTTIVHPEARTGPNFRVIIAEGKFHGVIARQTPTGRLMTTMRLSGKLEGIVSP